MHITLSLLLPRDEASIPVVRHICAKALEEIYTEPETISDIEIALTEACANVVEHSGPGDDYGVDVTIDDKTCVIRVVDHGQGLAKQLGPNTPPDLHAEGGRGFALMHALVDRVHFESKPQVGTVVCLEKQLAFTASSVMVAAAQASDVRT